MDGCCFGFGSDGSATAGGLNGANNGTSVNGTTVVLGQDIGAPGNPGALLSTRHIPMNDFAVDFLTHTIDGQQEFIAIDGAVLQFSVAGNATAVADGGGEPLVSVTDLGDSTSLSLQKKAVKSFILPGGGVSMLWFDDPTGSAILQYGLTPSATDTSKLLTVLGDVDFGMPGTTNQFSMFGALMTNLNPNLIRLSNGAIEIDNDSGAVGSPSINFADTAGGGTLGQFSFTTGIFNLDQNLTITGSIQTADPGAGAAAWDLGNVHAGTVALDTTRSVQVKIGATVLKLGVVV